MRHGACFVKVISVLFCFFFVFDICICTLYFVICSLCCIFHFVFCLGTFSPRKMRPARHSVMMILCYMRIVYLITCEAAKDFINYMKSGAPPGPGPTITRANT